MRQKPSPEKHRIYQQTYHQKHPGLKAKWNKDWIANNSERYNASKFIYRERLKREVFEHYGHGVVECVQCGFSQLDALCLDHINNDGAEQRRLLGISSRGSNSGQRTYEALKKADYPEGIQILCANCNMIKELERKRQKRLQNKFYEQRSHTPTSLRPKRLPVAILSGYGRRM